MPEQKNIEPEPAPVAPEANNLAPNRLEELLVENLALTREIHALTSKTRRYIYFAQVATVIKLVLIIGPLIAAALFLPPYLKQALAAYKELLGNGTGETAVEGNNIIKSFLGTDLEKLQEMKDLLDDYQKE